MRRILVILLGLFVVVPAHGQGVFRADASSGASIDQKIGAEIPLDLEFVDENGRKVRLGDFFGDRPVVLTPVYYSCPMLCNLVLDGLVRTALNLKFDIGDDYEIVTVSFDHTESFEMAKAKKDLYTRRYGRPGVGSGWHFLTGEQLAIRDLMESVGFGYSYDSIQDQYAHAAAIIVLTPDGVIARYFYGFEYDARDLRLGLVEASDGQVGTPIDDLLLLCFSYDPATGKYSRIAMNAVRVGGTLTVVCIFGFIFIMVRRDKKGGG